MKKCNSKCLCIKCSRSCMTACRKCNREMDMHVRACKEYVCECAQLNLSDFLTEVDKISTRGNKIDYKGF